MKLLCNVTTKQIRDLAIQLGEKPAITTNKISLWQSINGTTEIPSLQELKNLQADLDSEKQSLIPENAKLTEIRIDDKKVPFFVSGPHIFNANGEIVLNEDNNPNRNKVYANLAVQEGRAVVVEDAETSDKYIVNNKRQIMGINGEVITENTNGFDKNSINRILKQVPKDFKFAAPKIEIYKGNWTREEVEKATDKVFLFEDNTEDRINAYYTPSSTQDVIRGLPNAIGIDTKKNRGTSEGTTRTINIYAGARENAELSNFAERPFIYDTTIIPVSDDPKDYRTRYKSNFILDYTKDTFPLERAKQLGLTFKTVEGAFQAAKLGYVKTPEPFGQKSPYYTAEDSGLSPTPLFDEILTKLANASGAEAKRIGRTIQDLQVEKWDRDSSAIMKVLIGQSFEQNSEALQKLLATGEARLTHIQDKGKWGTEFPKLIMEVREELGGQAPSTNANSSYFTDADFNQFKAQVDEAIQKAIDSGKTIVLPADGIGSAQLKESAPKLFNYLQEQLSKLQNPSSANVSSQWSSHNTNNLGAEPMVPAAKEYVPEEITYVPTLQGIPEELRASAVAKLSSVFSPIQLTARIHNIARLFSNAIDTVYSKYLEELREEMESLPANSLEKLDISYKIQRFADAKSGRNNFVDEMNVNAIIDEVKRNLVEKIKTARDNYIKNQNDKTLYILDQYVKMGKNIELLLVHAVSEIEANEGIRLAISQDATVDGDVELGGNQLSEIDLQDDNLEEKIVSGNSGWAFDTRKADPHTTQTRNVRRILRNILLIGKHGVEKDDIGEVKYVDGEYAYATLLNNLSWMIDSSDFHTVETDVNGERVVDEDGEFIHHLPALENLVKRFTWLNGVLNELYANPDLIPEFYSCLRLDYIQYNMVGATGHFAPVNREMGVDSAIDSITRNYEQGTTLDEDSIFGGDSSTNLENAKKGEALVEKLSNDLLNRDFADDYEDLFKVLHMLGIETNENLAQFLDWKDGVSIEKILRNAKIIFNNLPLLKDTDHLIAYFRSQYEEIGTIVGEVTEFNRSMTHRQGDADYPSYSTPNFATTQFKKFTSRDERRRQEIFDFYKQDDVFYDKKNGRWLCTWAKELESNSALLEELRDGRGLVNMLTIREATSFGSETVEYKDWTPQQIIRAFLSAYWSADNGEAVGQHYAYYNFPIFSDSTCAMFMKFLRYTGENYETQILPLLRNVVYQEFVRKARVEKRKGLGQDIANYDKNGDKFFYFPELNTYKVNVAYDDIVRFYENQHSNSNNKEEKEAISSKLSNLKITPETGECSVSFEDAVKMYKSKGDVNAVNATIDSAVKFIVDMNFADFFNTAVKNSELLSYMVQEGIVPQSAVDSLSGKEGDTSKDKERTQFTSVEDALREYFWNDTLAQYNIIQLMVGDLAFYKFDNGIDFQKRFKEVYASGRKLDTASKYGREIEKTAYLSDRITTSRIFNYVKSVFNKAVEDNKISRAEADEIIEKFKEINNADAQAFRSPKSMRAVLDMAGMWNDSMEAAFNRLMNGEFDVSDFSVIWQALKPFMYSLTSVDDGLGGKTLVPVQHKNSEYLLLAAFPLINEALNASTTLKALCRFMEDNDIDVIQYESAVKSGAQGVIDINYSKTALESIREDLWDNIHKAAAKELGSKFKAGRTYKNLKAGLDFMLDHNEISDSTYSQLMDAVAPTETEIIKTLHDCCYNSDGTLNPVVVHELPYSSYVIQTPTPEHWIDNKVVDGSQKRNLLPADLPDDFKVTIGGKTFNKTQILDLYDSLIVENLLDDYEEVKDEVSDTEELQKSLLNQIKGNPKYSRDFLNALTLIDYNGQKDFTIPLDFPTMQNQVVQLILSKFKNAITKQKAKGGTCIIAADPNNELNIVLKDGSVLNTKDKNAINDAVNNDNIEGFECYLPAWTKSIYEKYLITKKINGKEVTVLDFDRLKKEAPELLKISGIRIPTEGKYSITPLIVKGFLPSQAGSSIMLPADITLITGCDMDVDKMFIRIYNFKQTEDGIKKIKYDYNLSPDQQSREARENALLDIELAIMCSKDVAEALFTPGGFDPIKKDGVKMEILYGTSNTNRPLMYIWQEEHKINMNDYEKTLASLDAASLSEMSDFINKFSKIRNVGSIQTFIYNHQQNMSGAALIGMYANNTTAQAKAQTTRLAIKDEYTFNINGKTIKSLHDIYTTENGKKVRISKNCAYFSAASVDNVKFPVLAKIGQNTETAPIAGFMLRSGMSVDEISLLFSQPQIMYLINAGSPVNAKTIAGQLEYLQKKFDVKLDQEKIASEIFKHSFTSKELGMIIAEWNRYKFISESEMRSLPKEQREDYVSRASRALYLFSLISTISSDLRGSVGISRADSPNGAIAITLEDMNLQIERVDDYLSNASNSAFTLEHIHDIIQNRVCDVTDSKATLRKKLLGPDVKMRRHQAFYTLGIELAQQIVADRFISQSREAQNIVGRIQKELGKPLVASDRRKLYKDFITYLLSTSKEFGEDYENKRNYYLYQFPNKFNTILKQNPDLAAMPALNALRISEGKIIMENSHRLSEATQESIRTSFDQLLFGENEIGSRLAQDLFMYSYYNEGFNFSHNSYGHFFSTTFLMSFPGALNILRNTHPDAQVMNNFFEQWISQKENLRLIHSVPETDVKSKTERTITIDKKKIPINRSRFVSQSEPYLYINVNNALYTLVDVNDVEYTYAKVPEIDPGITLGNQRKYNANVTAAELAQNNTEESRIANAKLLNTLTYKRSLQANNVTPENSANNVENLGEVDSLTDINVNSMENVDNVDISNIENVDLSAIEGMSVNINALEKTYDESAAQQVQIDNNGKILC